MHMAQLQVSDFPSGTRRLGQKNLAPHNLSVQNQRPFPLAKIVDSLDHALPIPNDPHSFSIYFVALLLVVAGMMISVLLSAQILQSKVQLGELQNREEILERQNGELLWKIARATNLQQVQSRAIAQGYRPITKREYIGMPLPDAERDGLTLAHSMEKPGALIGNEYIAPAQPPINAGQAPLGQRLGQWRALLLGDSWPEYSASAPGSSVEPPASSPASVSPDLQAAPWWRSLRKQIVADVEALADRIDGE